MAKLTFPDISLTSLRQFVNLQPQGIADYQWTRVDRIPLTERERQQLEEVKSRLLNYRTHLMNEATIWSRAIYPLLVLAERGAIQAWAEVGLYARYSRFEVEGIADGALGQCEFDLLEAPYLVVVEAKRGIENKDPQAQLYAQLLAAAHLNWEKDALPLQEIFGCYTIADTWNFVRAEVEGIDAEVPTLRLEFSREYSEKLEIETIFKIVKAIVGKYIGE